MRKIFLFFAVILTSQYLTAQQSQNKKLFHEIEAGVVVNATEAKILREEGLEFEKNIFTDLLVRTNRSYHEVMYGFVNHSFNFINGYFLDQPKEWDVYIVYSAGMKEKWRYGGIGLEKEFEFKKLKIIPYLEYGYNNHSKNFISLGLFISKQAKLWVRK